MGLTIESESKFGLGNKPNKNQVFKTKQVT